LREQNKKTLILIIANFRDVASLHRVASNLNNFSLSFRRALTKSIENIVVDRREIALGFVKEYERIGEVVLK